MLNCQFKFLPYRSFLRCSLRGFGPENVTLNWNFQLICNFMYVSISLESWQLFHHCQLRKQWEQIHYSKVREASKFVGNRSGEVFNRLNAIVRNTSFLLGFLIHLRSLLDPHSIVLLPN